jgi:hypothetical protein
MKRFLVFLDRILSLGTTSDSQKIQEIIVTTNFPSLLAKNGPPLLCRIDPPNS